MSPFSAVVGAYTVIRFLALLLLMELWRGLDHGLFLASLGLAGKFCAFAPGPWVPSGQAGPGHGPATRAWWAFGKAWWRV
jgi:hypothetical protein